MPLEKMLRVTLPDHIRSTQDGSTLVLDVHWYHPVLWFLAALLACFCKLALSSDLIWLFGTPMIVVAYGIVAGFFNHTRIAIGSGGVDVRVGPMPWPGTRRLEASEIKQVFSQKVPMSLGRGNVVPGLFTYSVGVITPQDRKVWLISGLPDPKVALHIEHLIESAIGIKDRDVPGELDKGPSAL